MFFFIGFIFKKVFDGNILENFFIKKVIDERYNCNESL